MMVISEQSLPVLNSAHEPLAAYFLSPVQLRSGSDRAAKVGTWCPARL